MTDPNANHEPLGKRALANQSGTSYQQIKFDIKRIFRFSLLLTFVVLAVSYAIQAPLSLFITVPMAALVLVANHYTRRSTTPKGRRS